MLWRSVFFFFFKQKTAYEMRISDWSSDVCSSDLNAMRAMNARVKLHGISESAVAADFLGIRTDDHDGGPWPQLLQRSAEHLRLVAISLGLAILLAVPLGILAARRRRFGQLVIGLTGENGRAHV